MKFPQFLTKIFLLSTVYWPTASFGQGTLTFDGTPTQPQGTAYFIQQYTESGMWFRPMGDVGPGNGFGRVGGGISFYPEDGSAYIDAPSGSSLVFSFQNDSVFGISSIDLAEYSTAVPNPVTVSFVGYHPDGSIITTSFTTDGVIDGTGPLKDFQTFNFGSGWTDLTRVEIPTDGWSLDNLVVLVPEPGAGSMLALCTLTSIIHRIKK